MAKPLKKLGVILGCDAPLEPEIDARWAALSTAHEILERVETDLLIGWLPIFERYAKPKRPDLRVVYGK